MNFRVETITEDYVIIAAPDTARLAKLINIGRGKKSISKILPDGCSATKFQKILDGIRTKPIEFDALKDLYERFENKTFSFEELCAANGMLIGKERDMIVSLYETRLGTIDAMADPEERPSSNIPGRPAGSSKIVDINEILESDKKNVIAENIEYGSFVKDMSVYIFVAKLKDKKMSYLCKNLLILYEDLEIRTVLRLFADYYDKFRTGQIEANRAFYKMGVETKYESPYQHYKNLLDEKLFENMK